MSKLSPTPDANPRISDSEKSHQSEFSSNVNDLEAKLRSLEKQLDSLRLRSSTSLPGALTQNQPSTLVRAVTRIDRWGDPDPRPRTVWGGICTLLFVVGLVAYGITLYLMYEKMAPETTSTVLWSVVDGPYPLVLTCYSEQCLVSWNYNQESAQAKGCVARVPPSRCVALGPGEQVTVDVCYSQLPGQGVRLHFGGESAWGAEAWRMGLTDEATRHYFGMTSTSYMGGGDKSMATIQTPLRSGITQMTYVRTDNGTLPDGDPGKLRHEWFSMSLSPTAHDSDFTGDPCALNPPQNSSVNSSVFASMQRTALFMHPDYTHIKVKNPPNFAIALLGEIGGASEAYSVFVLFLLLTFYKVLHCKHQRSSVQKSASGGEDGEEGAAQQSCCHALAHSLCP